MLPFSIAQSLLSCYSKRVDKKFYYRENKFIEGFVKSNYFKDVVLPSVKLPYKGSYSIPEACKIMGCSRTKLWQLGRKGVLVIAPNKKIYCREFENLFNVNEEK